MNIKRNIIYALEARKKNGVAMAGEDDEHLPCRTT